MVPSSGVSGIALGLSGAASVLLELSWPTTDVAAVTCIVSSAAVWLAFTASRVTAPRRLAEDFRSAGTLSPYGAYQMTFLFLCLRLVARASVVAALVGLWFGAAAQLAVMASFLAACYRERRWPEPLYNPTTVNCAVTAIVGASLAPRRRDVVSLTVASFCLAVFLAAVLVPVETYRVLADDRVSASAAVAMLQAPWSLTALTWGVMRRAFRAPIIGPRADRSVTHALFAASTIVLATTLFAVWRRRNQIRHKGVAVDWAAFTFPSCSSAVAALQYAANDLVSFESSLARRVLAAYAHVLSALVLGVVAAVVAATAHLALRSRDSLADAPGPPKLFEIARQTPSPRTITGDDDHHHPAMQPDHHDRLVVVVNGHHDDDLAAVGGTYASPPPHDSDRPPS
ncbi:hypothetical protein CTAYLR_007493 [Chrysophaeum taylorii]|uniref:Uncharacterized protein n=1 Tax=Chrysophaeum taylorii TaxID=2483200 RepID=A0AAD7UK12_9STRA|nr:hypothetical protein CTAYLR_007493 [Chrysophaeum taylorii]